MNMKQLILDHEFYCTQCGNKGIPIVRKEGAERKPGHLKKLFCLKCNKETNHVECVPWSKYTYKDFLIEFNHNNFNKDGTRKYNYNELKGLI